MIKEKIQQFFFFQKTKQLYRRFERFVMPATLLLGLMIDFFTFKNVKISTAFLLLGLHFLCAGLIIAYRQLYDAKRIPRLLPFRYLRLFAPLLLQFFFGALLSASFIFYWFSAAVSVSWPFIFLIAFLMVANDVFREFYLKPVVQVTVYYFVTFSLFTLVLPYLSRSIDARYFLLSGLLSLVFINLYLHLLWKFAKQMRAQRKQYLFSIAAVFLVMNAAYFFNVIPPIPLSLREAGVYHDIRRHGPNYILQSEQQTLLQKLVPGQTIHWQPGSRISVFTSVYAPTDFRVPITHQWQYYDESRGRWISKDTLSFPLTGGRQDGYRGYTTKSALAPGRWRVNVQTSRGQVIGRIRFTVVETDQPPVVKEILR